MSQSTIKMNCDCGKVHTVGRDEDAPDTATSMGCNWCPSCEDTADDYYNEWYNTGGDEGEDYGDDPNQLLAFSIADDILNRELELTRPEADKTK